MTDAAPDRLILSAFELLARHGAYGVTARAVADRAALNGSAVNYHFGGREGLIAEVFAAAHGRACAWRARWSASLTETGPVETFPRWFALACDDWCFDQPELVSVLRELMLDAGRNGPNRDLAEREALATLAFWQSVVAIFDLPAGAAQICRAFVDGVSRLHSVRPEAPDQRLWFGETLARFASRLSGSHPLAGWDGWRLALLREAKVVEPVAASEPSPIVKAAADLIGLLGPGGLTHRAVAARAGVSLAVVTHAFPTRAALVKATFASVLAQLSASGGGWTEEGSRTQTPAEAARRIADIMITEDGAANASALAAEELLSAIARDPLLRDATLSMRIARGENGRTMLAVLVGGENLDGLDAHIFSSLVIGTSRVANVVEPARRRAWLCARLAEQLEWLVKTSATDTSI